MKNPREDPQERPSRRTLRADLKDFHSLFIFTGSLKT
jgi:hypothetical protein